MPKVIAIAGMGLCGNAIFCRLSHLLATMKYSDDDITILIFEQNPQYLATGFAYSIDSPEFWTLNNPADGFKFTSTTDSLTEWIDANPELLQDHYPHRDKQYIPRAVVGHYLRAQYEKHKTLVKSLGITVKEIFLPISDICPLKEGNYQIACMDQNYIADRLFITTGHLTNPFFHTVENQPGFLRFENTTGNPDAWDLADDVYIIGGQAAFVDAALWLTMKKQYSGKIHSVTRNPTILTTKGNTDSCDVIAQQELSSSLQKRSPGSLTFAEAKILFWNAYQKDAKSPVDSAHLHSSTEALRYQMNKFDHLLENNPIPGNIDELRAFIKTFYFSGCYTHMWQSLNVEGKEQFLKYFYSLLMAYLTGITPVNARIMLHLYEKNRIIEHHGLASVNYDEVNHRFRLLFTSGEVLHATTLIDATGYRYKPDPNSVKPMLLDNLAQTGLITAKPYGGIHLTDHYQVIDKHGKVHENLFCIGPIANYNHPVPTPHSSFMAYRDADLVIEKFASTFNTIENRVTNSNTECFQ
ncbi:FAD/NAD(P)-binding protein [Legionella pneumophila]